MSEALVKVSVRKGDLVQVIAGGEKGKTGKVLSVSFKTGRVKIENVNVVKRHVKASAQNPQGGITQKELGLHASNVLLVCPKCERGVRFGVKLVSGKTSSKKVRVCKRCSHQIDAT